MSEPKLKVLLLLFSFLISVDFAFAQDESEVEQDTVAQTAKVKRKWHEAAHVKLQFAGSIGFISPAVGVSWAKDKIESDLFFGYLPKKVGGEHIVMLTLKNTYTPFSIEPKNSKLTIYPLSIGGFLNYTFGNQYETFWPDYYPTGYYWWDSAIRLGFFLGGSVAIPVKNKSFDSISGYYELGTNDLYLISYVQNLKYFEPYDILNLAIGVKIAF